MVPKDKVARLRMKLAEGGLPKGGGVGYEIFDKSDALGATSFIQNINHLRALEGELARTIRGIDRVQAARVHLVLPERPLFSRDKAEASASIVLKVRGTLEPQQVRAIRHLVATAVNGMKPERVSVIDETGKLLADGAAQDNPQGGAGADERKMAFENRLRNQVEAIVSSVVGPGHARVQLTADFDFNRITQTSDKFDPDGRVLRSSQTREEQSSSGDGKDGGAVSVGNELPGSNKPAEGGGGGRDQNRKTEEIVNYEISRTTKTEVIEAGRDQPHFGGRAGRRQLQQERQGRDGLSAARRRKRSTASRRWCARRSASTPSAATRSRWSICALPKPRRCRSTSRPAG